MTNAIMSLAGVGLVLSSSMVGPMLPEFDSGGGIMRMGGKVGEEADLLGAEGSMSEAVMSPTEIVEEPGLAVGG